MKYKLLFLIALVSNCIFCQNFHDTQGRFEITNNGQASYTLPIALPPSIKSVGPTINLEYSSGLQGGIAGQGWNISTISNISRIATRKDIDGFKDGVDFDSDDKLSFNGQRLLLKAGTGSYWADGSVYETEVRTNDKIELIGSGVNMYFLVTAPDGSRTWYGNYGGMNATDMTAFYIVRFEDIHGNFILYNYFKPLNKSLCIKEILFSANTNTNTTPLNKIDFTYEAAARSEYAYIKGIKIEKAEILKKIEVSTNGLLFRKYLLTHSVDAEGYQRVNKIEEFNGAGEAANPIIFDYYTTEANIDVIRANEGHTYTDQYDVNDITLSGDFDGDSKLDFVISNRLYKNALDGHFGTINLPFIATKRLTLPVRAVFNNKLVQNQVLLNVTEENQAIKLKLFTPGQPYQLAKTIVMNNEDQCIDYCTAFDYDQDGNVLVGPGHPATVCNNQIKDTNKYLEGDFNGDGISEILVLGYDRITTHSLQLVQPGDDPLNTGTGPGEPYYDCVKEVSNSTYTNSVRLINLDPNTSSTQGTTGNILLPYPFLTYFNGKINIGDFNGDGKDDVLSILPDRTYKVLSFRQLLSAPWVEVEILGEGIIDQYNTNKQLLFGDYNGDGKMDLMMPEKEGEGCEDYLACYQWHIYFSNPKLAGGNYFEKESHNITAYMPLQVYSSGQTFVNYYFPMDSNKDGKTDLVRFELWYRHEPNGWQGDWRVHTFTNNIGNNNMSVARFSNDYLSTFYSNEFTINSIPIVANQRSKNLTSDILILHHKETEFGYYKYCKYLSFTKNFVNDNALKKVTQSGGAIIDEVFYGSIDSPGIGSIAEGVDLYSSGNSQNYPFVELKQISFSKLVSKIKNTSAGSVKFQDFKYHGLVIQTHGLGMIGYKKVARSVWYLNDADKKIWTLTENDPTKRGAMVKNSSHLVAGNTPFNIQSPGNSINSTINTYNQNTDPNTYCYSILLDTQISTDNLTGVVIQKKYNTYTPDYLLPDKITVSNFLGSTLHGSTVTLTDYVSNVTGTGSGYYIGRPRWVSTATTVNVNTPSGSPDTKSSEEEIFYANGNVSRTEKKSNLSTEKIVEDFTYYPNGLLQTKTISATGTTSINAVSPRTTTYTYDPTNRFVKKTTDTEGLITENLSYHNLYGLVTQQLNSYGQITTSLYDNWGKRIKITDFLGKSVDYSYVKSSGLYTTTESGDDGSGKVFVSDALARVVKKGSKDINGNWVYVDTEYDFLNKKLKDSEPYFSGSSPTQWTSYEYDDYSRPTKTILYTGKIVSTNYNGLTVTANEPTMTKSKTMNANGQVVIATDTPGGTINFKYDANNNLVESDYDGIISTITYDNWGRKTQLVDTSAGTYTYSYNAYGEILKEGTPKGNTTYTLNPAGKVVTKAVVGLSSQDGTNITSTYSYDPTYKWLTNIAVVNPNDGNSNYAYTYDLTGSNPTKQLKKTVETLSGVGPLSPVYATFTKELSFDVFGRTSTETSTAAAHGQTSTKTITRTYKNGQDWQLKDGNSVLWQSNTANARGQITSASLGNGINITNSFDSYGYVTQNKHLKNSTDIMTLNNEFEPIMGNLIKRYNSLFDYTDTFTFDSLDRLTAWDANDEAILNLEFTTTDEGFTYVGGNGGSVSSYQQKLKVYAAEEFAGTQKQILSNAPIGKKIRIRFNYTKQSGPGIVKAKIIEIDPVTSDSYEEDLGEISNGAFEKDYRVNYYGDIIFRIYIEQDPENPENIDPLGTGGGTGPILPYATFLLDNFKVEGVNLYTQNYDDRGRITENNLGQYQYTTTAKPYQNTSIFVTPEADAYYSVQSIQSLTYNAFKAPIEIIDINDRVDFGYNVFQKRCIMYYGNTLKPINSRPYRKYYSADGSMEIKATFAPGNTSTPAAVEFITYLGGDAYTSPVILKSDGVTANYFYLHRDYQGSILAVTDGGANIVEKRLFDPWGAIIRVADGSGNNLTKLTFFDRGYTGHEHMQGVRLVNMNARLYDPKLHRFLQPDNYIQDPNNTQNYNRYSYCFNNPLKYTDVTGNYGVEAALIIGVAIALAVHITNVAIHHQKLTVSGVMETLTFAVISSGISFGIGEAVSTISSFALRASVQSIAHGASQGGLTAIQGGEFWSSFASGSISSIASSAWTGGSDLDMYGKPIAGSGFGGIGGTSGASMIAFGTIAGGAGSALTGGNFWQGAVTGLVVSGLNHAMHKIENRSYIDRRLRSLGKNPNDPAQIEESQLGDFAEDMFPALSDQTDDPAFKLKDKIKGAYGQTVTYIDGKGGFRASHIEISRSAFENWRLLASTIGHEMNHYFFYNSGAVDRWVRKYGETAAFALDEFKAHYWELKWGGVPGIDVMYDNLRIFKARK